MAQKFFASLIVKHLRTLALLFVLFGAAQQLSAQSLVAPSVAVTRLKQQNYTVSNQMSDFKGTETQIGMQNLRLEYYANVSENLRSGNLSTQEALDKGALVMVERFQKLPNTTVTLTTSHVQTVVSETTTLLSN